ncbi:hypothetical protein SANT12839_010720 [Streptomyces antimycoticus]|uniref:FAD-binding domain-containing protein n=1 Tax=Streptomyces antimycoticus TaxID=68175 RepID=A0A4D4JZD0_9ACTN|nr:hypothetical protein SANT12839_010720 [Streptomyces antimycoticus]
MGGMNTAPKRTILVSGASIAGPALAYWLHRYGFAVTVVEKAAALRGGGYPIDIRGTAVEVVRRMGVLPNSGTPTSASAGSPSSTRKAVR